MKKITFSGLQVVQFSLIILGIMFLGTLMVCRLFVAQHMSRLETFSVTGILFSCIIAIAYIIYARAIKTQEDFVYFYDSNLKLVKELENLKSKLSDAELNLSQLRGELD